MKLRELRLQKLLTLKELAEAAGVSVATITAIEGGRQLPTPKTSRRLGKALGIEPQGIDEATAWSARYREKADAPAG